ncbi:MAG: three-helix bundle dimerization domain-containing protein [Mycobacterium leprae]
MSTTSVELQLAHVITRLQQSHPELAEAEIRHIVAAAMHDLDKARLRQFVPLLVEKSAKAACRERCTSRRQPQRADASMPPNDNDPAASAPNVPSRLDDHGPGRHVARHLRRGLPGRAR